MNGLSLFSGIGGLDVALSDYVRPIAYCEIEPYCQAVLLNRQFDGLLPRAPIWDDITTLRIRGNGRNIHIIYGGFPCQDISIAGHGKGLAGKRSRLFFEIMRLAKEIKPKFLFIENVPAITTRGGIDVVREITSMGYDCRWCVISAASCGARHRRERWFLLAHANDNGSPPCEKRRSTRECLVSRKGKEKQTQDIWKTQRTDILQIDVAISRCECERSKEKPKWPSLHFARCHRYWEVEPELGRMADGIPNRMDRIKGLGNAVVPKQAKKAFEILMGLKKDDSNGK